MIRDDFVFSHLVMSFLFTLDLFDDYLDLVLHTHTLSLLSNSFFFFSLLSTSSFSLSLSFILILFLFPLLLHRNDAMKRVIVFLAYLLLI